MHHNQFQRLRLYQIDLFFYLLSSNYRAQLQNCIQDNTGFFLCNVHKNLNCWDLLYSLILELLFLYKIFTDAYYWKIISLIFVLIQLKINIFF